MVTAKDIMALFEGAGLRAPGPELKEELPLTNQGLDSLDLITLIYEVETRYNIEIPAEEAVRLRSVSNIVDFLNTTSVPDGIVA